MQGSSDPAKKNKKSACIEKGGVISYESQGRLGLRRVVRVPRSAERKTSSKELKTKGERRSDRGLGIAARLWEKSLILGLNF